MIFLQQTFGKNYKWWYIALYNLKLSGLGYFTTIMDLFGNIIFVIALMYVWNIKQPSQEIFTYLLIGRLYKSIAENYLYNSFASDILTGGLTNKLLNSSNLFATIYSQMIGRRAFRNLVETLGYLVATIICSYYFIQPIFNLQNFITLILFIPITFTINHFIGTVIGSMAFFIRDKRDFDGIGKFWLKIRDVTTGSLIPLTLLPFSSFFAFLPTSFVLHHPMQIYLGKYSTNEIIYTFLGGIVWCIVLWILARVIFKFGLKKNEAVGL
jgi:ABC-2 type transport system permease protein